MRCQNCSSNKDFTRATAQTKFYFISRYFRYLRVFFTFSAIGFVQFVGLAAAADPASKMDPVTWTETQSKAQCAREDKLAKEAKADLSRRRQAKFFGYARSL